MQLSVHGFLEKCTGEGLNWFLQSGSGRKTKKNITKHTKNMGKFSLATVHHWQRIKRDRSGKLSCAFFVMWNVNLLLFSKQREVADS